MTDCRLSPEKFKKLPQRKKQFPSLVNKYQCHSKYTCVLTFQLVSWSTNSVGPSYCFTCCEGILGSLELKWGYQSTQFISEPLYGARFWLLCGARTEFLPSAGLGLKDFFILQLCKPKWRADYRVLDKWKEYWVVIKSSFLTWKTNMPALSGCVYIDAGLHNTAAKLK